MFALLLPKATAVIFLLFKSNVPLVKSIDWLVVKSSCNCQDHPTQLNDKLHENTQLFVVIVLFHDVALNDVITGLLIVIQETKYAFQYIDNADVDHASVGDHQDGFPHVIFKQLAVESIVTE